MANNNLPEDLAEAFERMAEVLRDTTHNVDEFGRRLSDGEKEAKRLADAAKKRQQELERAIEESAERWKKVGNAALNTVKGMNSAEGAFETMGNITGNVVKGLASLASNIPIVGGAIKGLGEVAGEAIKFLTAETGKAFATFGKLSQSGVVESFQTMRESSVKLGLTYQQMNEVLAKNSKELANFGGTATAGRERLERISEQFNKTSKNTESAFVQMQKLGISASEFIEATANYTDMASKTGALRGKSDAEVAARAKEYSEELVLMARLTGKSREEQMKAQRDAMNNARFRAQVEKMRMSGDQAQMEAAKELTKMVANAPDSMKQGLMEYYGAGGNIVGKASAELEVVLNQGGKSLRDTNGLLTGQMKTAREGLAVIEEASGKVVENLADVVGAGAKLGDNFYVDMAELNRKRLEAAGKTNDQLAEEEKKRIAAQQAAADPAATAMKKAQDLAVQTGYLVTSTENLMRVNTMVGDALLEFMKRLNGAVNDPKAGMLAAFGGIALAVVAAVSTISKVVGAAKTIGTLISGASTVAGATTAGTAAAGTAAAGTAAAGTAAAGAMTTGAALVGAAAVGYGVGTYIVNPILDAITQTITGTKGETVGTALYGLISGKTDQIAAKDAEEKAKVELGKRKIAQGQPVSKDMADALKRAGVNVPPELILGAGGRPATAVTTGPGSGHTATATPTSPKNINATTTAVENKLKEVSKEWENLLAGLTDFLASGKTKVQVVASTQQQGTGAPMIPVPAPSAVPPAGAPAAPEMPAPTAPTPPPATAPTPVPPISTPSPAPAPPPPPPSAPSTPSAPGPGRPSTPSGPPIAISTDGGKPVPLKPGVRENLGDIKAALIKRGFTDENYINAVLANVIKETGGVAKNENTDYSNTSNSRIREIFGKRATDMTDQQLNAAKQSKEGFAEAMYGRGTAEGRSMGNTEVGDGWKYRGRGYIGITGRAMYGHASKALFGDNRLVENPDLLNDPKLAAEATAWYMEFTKKRTFDKLKISGGPMDVATANQAATSQIAGPIVNRDSKGYLSGLLNKVDSYSSQIANMNIQPTGMAGGAVPSQPPTAPGTPGAPAIEKPGGGRPQTQLAGVSGMQQAKDHGLKIRGTGDVVGGGPITDRALQVALQAQNVPGFWMFTGLNDRYHQEKHPRSQHAFGRGIDLVVDPKLQGVEETKKLKEKFASISGVAKALNEYHWPPDGDRNQFTTGGHFHLNVQARDGGIFDGPNAGYPVEMHGREIIAPLKQNSILEKLASTPASTTTLNGSTESKVEPMMEQLTTLFSSLDNKFDAIINLLSQGNRNSRIIAQNVG